MPPPDYSTAFQLKLDQISHFRRELQVEYHAEYERALVEVKMRLRRGCWRSRFEIMSLCPHVTWL